MDMDAAYKSRWQRKKYAREVAHDKEVEQCFDCLFFAEERNAKLVEDFTPSDFDDWRRTLPPEKQGLYTQIVSDFLAWANSPSAKTFPQKLFDERLLVTGDDHIASPQRLLKRLDIAFGPTQAGERSMTFRCYFWLLWAGLRPSEAIEIEEKDVDLDEMEVRSGDKLLAIPIEAYADFATLLDTGWYYDRNRVKRPKEAGDRLLRWYMPYTLRALGGRISIIQQDVPGPTLTARVVRRSGMFYRAFLRELDGIPATFTAEAAEDSNDSETSQLDVAHNYDIDYVIWKYRCVLPLVADTPRPTMVGSSR